MKSDIGDDMLIVIFTYLRPSDLRSVDLCSKRFRTCVNQNIIWSPHLERVWSEVTINRPKTLLLEDRVKEISLSKLKIALKGVNTVDCIEKEDYRRALAARLFFRGRKYMKDVPYKQNLPSWSLYMNNFKVSYYFGRQERTRTSILKSELCTIRFRFFFKHSPEERGWEVKFFDDYTLHSEMHGELMTWQYMDYDDIDGGKHIQIEHYPVLRFSRLKNGVSWFRKIEIS